MEIINAIIVVSCHSADRISLNTNLPSPIPFVDKSNLTLNFQVQIGKGVEYVKNNFNLTDDQIELIQSDKSEAK